MNTVEIFGHKYSKTQASKFQRNLVWPCTVETCKKLHSSKWDKCKECREIKCTRCNKKSIIASKRLCAYCESLKSK